MNTILQKRIEEAAKKYCRDKNYILPDDTELSLEALTAIDAYIEAAKSILQNQWISVDEALPEMIDEDMEWSDVVLIKCKYCENMKPCIMTSRYDVGTGFWLNPVAREITHWMPIPQIEGGEK